MGAAAKVIGWGTLHATVLFASEAHCLFSVHSHFKQNFPLHSPTLANTAHQATLDKVVGISIGAFTALVLTIAEKFCRSGSSTMHLTYREAASGFAASITLLFLGWQIDKRLHPTPPPASPAANIPAQAAHLLTNPAEALRTI